MFKFSGKRPRDVGVKDGRFSAARTWKPNWVSSEVEITDAHYAPPLKFTRDAKAAMQRLAKVLQAHPRAKIVEQKDNYLYAEFSTPLMGYVDDVEFHCCDGKAIHVRSSSRLGIRDFNVNRKRVEAIRAEFEKNS
jgi:uncharacterized protein (DUF1499 family)